LSERKGIRKRITPLKILLLYDMKEKDLARGIQDFLEALELEVLNVPLAPDQGKTLQGKEETHFKEAEGAVFLITPGCERDGALLPSPSVADEMGRAKQRFGAYPERVIYLVDKTCRIQSVDQKSYISFDRSDMRSVLEALTGLVGDLSAAGLVGQRKARPHQAPAVDIAKVAKEIPEQLRQVCAELSRLPNGAARYEDFTKMIEEKLGLSVQQTNFAVRDLQLKGLVTFESAPPPATFEFFTLTGVGWELARHEMKRSESMLSLARLLTGQRQGRS
jgi:hypothetical protein